MAVGSKNYLSKFENNIKIINHIHLKDKFVTKNKGINCRLGDGIEKFNKFFSILKLKKYDGKITLKQTWKNSLEAKKI